MPTINNCADVTKNYNEIIAAWRRFKEIYRDKDKIKESLSLQEKLVQAGKLIEPILFLKFADCTPFVIPGKADLATPRDDGFLILREALDVNWVFSGKLSTGWWLAVFERGGVHYVMYAPDKAELLPKDALKSAFSFRTKYGMGVTIDDKLREKLQKIEDKYNQPKDFGI
jgi:hypothetical protein